MPEAQPTNAPQEDYWELCRRGRACAEKLLETTGTATAALELQLAELELDICERQRDLQPIGDLEASLKALSLKWERAAEIERGLEAESIRLEAESMQREHNLSVAMAETLSALVTATGENIRQSFFQHAIVDAVKRYAPQGQETTKAALLAIQTPQETKRSKGRRSSAEDQLRATLEVETRDDWAKEIAAPDGRLSAPARGIPVGSPKDRLSCFMRENPGTTYADIKYSANVYTADFQRWRKDKLKANSVMSKRIEDVLSGSTPRKKKPPKSPAD